MRLLAAVIALVALLGAGVVLADDTRQQLEPQAADMTLGQVWHEAQALALLSSGTYTVASDDLATAAADLVPGDDGVAPVWDGVRVTVTIGEHCRALDVTGELTDC